MVTAPVERSEVRGHLQQIGKSAALTVGTALTVLAALSRVREVGRRDADRAARPARAAWVVQRLLAARW
jgi:hypothetical protein